MKDIIERHLSAMMRRQGITEDHQNIEIYWSNTYITVARLEADEAIQAIEKIRGSLVDLGLEVALSRNTASTQAPCFQLIIQAQPHQILESLKVTDHYAYANQALAKIGAPICFSYTPYNPPAMVPQVQEPQDVEENIGPDFRAGEGKARKQKAFL